MPRSGALPAPRHLLGTPLPLRQRRVAAVAVLTSPRWADVVELVAWRDGPELHVANSAGHCRLDWEAALAGRPAGTFTETPAVEHAVLSGEDPLARQDPLAAATAAAERAEPHPPASANHYPLAAVRLAQTFVDADRAPDLVVVHTDGHFWPERGGHPGEHGSLSVRQSRAPLVVGGAGAAHRGVVAAAAQIVDIAPTLLHAAGLAGPEGWEGTPLTDLISAPAPHVVGLLWDGANASSLLDLATAGELPAVARLLAGGTALQGGAVAEFPSVTLVNHTSALTGVGPGRHGIVHNVYFDRRRGERVLANDAGTWHRACDELRPGVQTLWEAAGVGMVAGRVRTACVNEPIDRGAGYSTFGLIRATGEHGSARSLSSHLPGATEDPHATQEWVAASADYAWSSRIDALGLSQVCQLFTVPEPPQLLWWNTTLTDTGHHGGGAHSPQALASLRDADRRLGVFLDLLEERGLTGSTTVLLTADHGSVAADPSCTGDWDEGLAAAGIALRDEGYGFLYLDAGGGAAEAPTR